MVDEEEWDWIEEQRPATSTTCCWPPRCPGCSGRGMHYARGVERGRGRRRLGPRAAGRWPRRCARPSTSSTGPRSRIRSRGWPSCSAAVGAGERGERAGLDRRALSGDVHHAYLFEVAFRRGAGVRVAVWQAVCSPYRNPLDEQERQRDPDRDVARASRRSRAPWPGARAWRIPAMRWRIRRRPLVRQPGGHARDRRARDRRCGSTRRCRWTPTLERGSSACWTAGWPEPDARRYRGRAHGLPGRELHRRGARAARPPLHEPRPAGVRAGQPAGDGEGRDVRPLLALPGHAAPAVPRRVRGSEAAPARAFDGEEGERARQLYERIFLGYGDDSVAQLGGAHIACEWVSNVMTKLLQRGRLAAYLEQSTRYIPYDAPMAEGLGYRYWRDPELGPEYERGDGLPLRRLLATRCRAWRPGRPSASRARTASPRPRTARSIRAKALDLLRGLLPAASLSHMGIFATGQAYEQLLLRLSASPLPEARDYARHDPGRAEGGDAQLRRARRAAGPRRRVDLLPRGARARRPSAGRGGSGSTERAARRAGRPRRAAAVGARAARTSCWRRCCSRRRRAPRTRPARRPRRCRRTSARRCSPSWSASARNRRHRPGRGFEALRYRFEVVSDYGAFRDLQRHRMLTVQWQTLGPELGAGVPDELEQAGVADALPRRARALARRVRADRGARAARAGARTRSASATGSATCST